MFFAPNSHVMSPVCDGAPYTQYGIWTDRRLHSQTLRRLHDMVDDYCFDYTKSRGHRFSNDDNTLLIMLVAEVMFLQRPRQREREVGKVGTCANLSTRTYGTPQELLQ